MCVCVCVSLSIFVGVFALRMSHVLSSKMSRMQLQKEKEEGAQGRVMDRKVTGHGARG